MWNCSDYPKKVVSAVNCHFCFKSCSNLPNGQGSGRGRLKATLGAMWAALSYNLTHWFALRRPATPTEAALAFA